MRSSAALCTPATGSAGKSRLRDTRRPISTGTPAAHLPAAPGPTWTSARPPPGMQLWWRGQKTRLRAGRRGVKSHWATY